jgi:hypothetical protein
MGVDAPFEQCNCNEECPAHPEREAA